MLCNIFRSKLFSIVNTFKLNRLTISGKYLHNKGMEQMIDEINSNHIKIITKIQDLEQKIALKEGSNQTKPSTHVLTTEDIQREKQRLIEENNGLKEEVNRLIHVLNELEAKRDPNSALVCGSAVNGVTNHSVITEPIDEKVVDSEPKEDRKQSQKSEKKAKKESKPNANQNKSNTEDKPIDVSRLDLRVGRIVSAKRHPDADSLYVEEIDCGEEKPRTVVSGLVRFVPLEEMTNRLVVVLCNLKPAKMRGITSEAMVMCASIPDCVQILDPPEGSQPGDRVVFDEYPGTADSQLNPKKKIWEQIAPDLKTNDECEATYKGQPFKVENKGSVKSKSLSNVCVK